MAIMAEADIDAGAAEDMIPVATGDTALGTMATACGQDKTLDTTTNNITGGST